MRERVSGEGPEATRALWLVALVCGLLVGVLSVAFHVSLDLALEVREWLTALVKPLGVGGVAILIGVCAGAVAFAVWLTERFAPEAAGSGIQHVKGVEQRRLPLWPLRVVWVKFVGGVVGIGGGLLLGREGPTVQMGASISEHLGARLGFDAGARRTLLAVGAGAGLAGAFNAPLAGTLLVVEELGARFVPAVYLGTLLAATVTDVVVRGCLGQVAELALPDVPPPSLEMLAPALAMGIVAGVVGVAFNGLLLPALDLVSRWKQRVPSWLLAAVLGAGLACVAWFEPALPGGGTEFAAHLLAGATPASEVLWLLPLAFGLTIASYAIGAPGGIFAPLLVLGALLGVALHAGWLALAPASVASMPLFAVAGMAALFAAIVRSPLTGAVLMIEMTGSYAIVLLLVVASLSAHAVAGALGGRPIYELLLDRACARSECAPGDPKP